MTNRSGRLNVVITREGSLSPRSRSGSASPSRCGHLSVEDKVPQQVNYQDVILLHRKWQNEKGRAEALQKEVAILHQCLDDGGKEAAASEQNAHTAARTKQQCKELQERMKTAKRLLDTSRMESVKLARVAVVKSRKLHGARKEAARVPGLTADVNRLLQAKRIAEAAAGEERKKAEEEEQRSKAWRVQVEKLSLQLVQQAERCRLLSTENEDLRGELERTRAQLKEARRERATAGELAENLRLKILENGILEEEIGAVRQDCGRLVQLVSSTKEYSHFRRLWDDSGSLTRLHNGGAPGTLFRAASSCGGDAGESGGVRGENDGVGGDGNTNSTKTNKGGGTVACGLTATFTPEGMHRLTSKGGAKEVEPPTAAAAAAATAATTAIEPTVAIALGDDSAANTWRQVMRSEWSSPSEKLNIQGVAGTALRTSPPSSSPFVTLGVAEMMGVRRSMSTPAEERRVEREGDGEKEAQGSPALEGRKKRLGGEGELRGRDGGVSPPERAKRAWRTAVTTAISEAKVTKDGNGIQVVRRGDIMPKSSESEACGANVGGGGNSVRWGRVDLFSVLYPPTVAGTVVNSDTNPNPDWETSMWVPQEAARLCRRFVRDIDGYSGLPLDAEQHRRLWSLLLGLNTSWRQSEEKRVERLRSRFRAQLTEARRQLNMCKPMKTVSEERVAERRRSSLLSSGSSTIAGTHGVLGEKNAAGENAGRPHIRWGKDGRRIRGRESTEWGDSYGVCRECRRSLCSRSSRHSKRAAVGRGKATRRKAGRGKRTVSSEPRKKQGERRKEGDRPDGEVLAKTAAQDPAELDGSHRLAADAIEEEEHYLVYKHDVHPGLSTGAAGGVVVIDPRGRELLKNSCESSDHTPRHADFWSRCMGAHHTDGDGGTFLDHGRVAGARSKTTSFGQLAKTTEKEHQGLEEVNGLGFKVKEGVPSVKPEEARRGGRRDRRREEDREGKRKGKGDRIERTDESRSEERGVSCLRETKTPLPKSASTFPQAHEDSVPFMIPPPPPPPTSRIAK